MRTMRDLATSIGGVTAEEEIAIRDWLRRFPQTDVGKRLAEKFPQFVPERANKSLHRTG